MVIGEEDMEYNMHCELDMKLSRFLAFASDYNYTSRDPFCSLCE